MRSLVQVVAGLVLAVGVGCAPPPELDEPETEAADTSDTEQNAGADATDPDGGESGETKRPDTLGDSRPRKANAPRIVRVEGGAPVARCAVCGEVLREDAATCPGCGDPVAEWSVEQPCTVSQRTGVARYVLSGELDVGEDFTRYLPTRWLPGVCRTSLDGTGVCPECAGSLEDSAGGTCLTCDGTGIVAECAGSGRDELSEHDGDCPVCHGSAVEVRGRPLPPPEEWPFTLRTGGSLLEGRLTTPPGAVVMIQRGDGPPEGMPKNSVQPLSYQRAVARFVATDDAQGHRKLATLAMDAGFWPLARDRLLRARLADPGLESQIKGDLVALASREQEDWLAQAREALQEGDFETARRWVHLVRVRSIGSGSSATRAAALLLRLDGQRKKALEEETEEIRAKRAASTAEVNRAVVTDVEDHLQQASEQLKLAERSPLELAGTSKLYHLAELHAWAAERDLLSQLWRAPASEYEWPTDPVRLRDRIRSLRAEILTAHAVRQLRGARFGYAQRLATVAKRIAPGEARAAQVLSKAEAGLLRQGVLQGSPPPDSPR